jgi:hypothetical protein
MQPPLPDARDAIETVENTSYDQAQHGRAVDAGATLASRPPLVGRASKARARCTWNDCDHREPDPDKLK